MKNLLIICFLLTIIQLSWATESNITYPGTYLIVGPNTIRSGAPYSVSVNILQKLENIHIDLVIFDLQNKTIAKTSQKNVQSGEPTIVKFEKLPEDLFEGTEYSLAATGVSAKSNKVLFEETKKLNLNRKYFSVFIQTDRATYKPGNKVNFRIIVTDSNLKPLTGKCEIKIKDPQQNIIKQFSHLTIDHGVIGKKGSLSFELSDEPVLGTWSISVEINSQTTDKNFEVEKYVLPKFEVSIKTPSDFQLGQDLVLLLIAKYTYGKGLNGIGLVSITNSWNENSTAIVKKLELNSSGETEIRISNKELQQHLIVPNIKERNTYYYYSSIVCEASVTENLSGKQINETGYVSINRRRYQVVIRKFGETFHPGMDFSFNVTIKHSDGNQLKSTDSRLANVTIRYIFPYEIRGNETYEPQEEHNQTLTLNANGSARVTVTTLINATDIYISCRMQKKLDENSVDNELCSKTLYLDDEIREHPSTVSPEDYDTEYVQAATSPTDSYLQLERSEENEHNVKVGENVFFVAKTTVELSTVTAQVVSRGITVYSKNFKMSGKIAKITFPATANMAPNAKLIVYGIKSDNKEILVDTTNMKIDGVFRNKVTIDVDPKSVEPNATVNFKIKASSKSYVGLLAVDKSVLLLRRGNDIESSDVEYEMSSYDSSYYPYYPLNQRKKRSFGWSNGEDARHVFDNAGVFVLTDAFLYSKPVDLWYASGGPVAAGPSVSTSRSAAGIVAVGENEKASVGGQAAPRIRSRFLETWIWADMFIGDNGEVIITAEAPDTITSFVATAFALHDTDGFAVAPEPAEVKVFRSFFIRLELPYSVKRGEKLALQIIVFNYMDKEQTVTVTLDHDSQSGFEFVEKAGEKKEKKDKSSNTRLVRVAANGGSSSAFFPIRPTKIGTIKLLAKAIGQGVSDGVESDLLVEAEGYPLYFNKFFAVDLSNESIGGNATKLDFPSDIVPGSQKVSISVVGDIMAPLLNNIGNLIQMPYGCGEQNMLHFVPNIVVSKYLKATNRLTPEKAAQSQRYMELGYQRELTYCRDDSSFSCFGKNDKNGSTWLTAFVVKSFRQAKPYIFVDDAVINKSLDFLMNQLKPNGAFEENGEVHDKEMQGGASEDNVAMSAYVLISLIVNERINLQTVEFLERSLNRISNNSYALAITCYVFHLTNNPKKDNCMNMLEKLAIKKENMKFWSKIVSHDDDKKTHKYWWYRPKPADIETTSYVLLIYVLRNETSKAIPIFRWLSKQQNAFGGYSSTQDTVIALQALSEYAEKVFSKDLAVTVSAKTLNKNFNFEVRPENALIQQTYQIPNANEPITINATGKGIAFGQISWHYNVLNLDTIKPFTCRKDVFQKTVTDLTLSLCCKYNLKGKSNMAVMEVQTPSGFAIDMEALNQLVNTIDVLQRIESVYDSAANLYFTSLNSTELCFNVTSERYYGLIDQQPAIVKLYDYYNPSERTEFEYNTIKNATLKDFCGYYCWPETSTNETIID